MNFKTKIAGLALALTLVVGVAAPAQAATTSELIDLLVSLGIISADQVAIVNAAVGGTTTTGTGSSTGCLLQTAPDMTLGATGANVTNLQTFLVEGGYMTMPAGVAYGYFGGLTQSSLGKYQAAMGITPAAGYFGRITRASITCVVETPVVDEDKDEDKKPSTSLKGGEGFFEIDTILDADVQIDLGKSEVAMEFEIEAIDSDIQIDRIDFTFDTRPWLYFDEVNLLVDGKEVASLSRSSDFREVSSDWRARFSGLDIVIEEDETIELSLELVVLNSMSGTRSGDSVKVTLDKRAIRGFDAEGIQQYNENPATDLIVSFEEAFGQGDVSIILGDDSPSNAIIVLNEKSRTNNVTVLTFDVESDDSDVEIKDVKVDFATSVGATTSVSQLVNRAKLYLYNGKTPLATKSVNGNSVTFDGIDFTIEENDVDSFRVELDFNKTSGLTLKDFTVAKVWVVGEDEDYEEAKDDMAINETHKLVVEGLVGESVSNSATTQALGDDTIAIFTFEVELTAVENTFYIAEDGTGFTVSLDNATDTEAFAIDITSKAKTVNNGTTYRISKGQSETFTVQVQAKSKLAGTHSIRATVDSIAYFDNVTLTSGAATTTLGSPDYRSVSKTVYKK